MLNSADRYVESSDRRGVRVVRHQQAAEKKNGIVVDSMVRNTMLKQVVRVFALLVLSSEVKSEIDYACTHLNDSWVVSGYSQVYQTEANVYRLSIDYSNNLVNVYSHGIPDYDRYFTTQDITFLNNRPKRSDDFISGSTTSAVGDYVQFGDDIGFETSGCSMGYWPPGPVCAEEQTGSDAITSFTLLPAEEDSTSGCYAGNGAQGLLVNGVALFGWSDTNTYSSAGIWHQTAISFEYYDFDICNGHAAMGLYHHHTYPPCLAEKLNDTGQGHSPIYGWIKDGFPIYGPYQSASTLAESCWKKRDYSASSTTGCGVNNERSCIYKDPFDIAQGTETVTDGPLTTDTVTSLSGNTFTAVSGFYYEDYYYDSTCGTSGGQYLNEYNVHDHDDLGFHYHFTIDSNSDPVFPYSMGVKFYGCITDDCYTDIPDHRRLNDIEASSIPLVGPSPTPYSNVNVGSPPRPPPGGGGGRPRPPGPSPGPGPSSPTGNSKCKSQVNATALSDSSCANSAYDSSWVYRGSTDGDDYDDLASGDDASSSGNIGSSGNSSGLSTSGVIALSVCLSVFFCCSVIAYYLQNSSNDPESKVYVSSEVQMAVVDQSRTELAEVRTKGKSKKYPTAAAYKV